MDIRSRQLCRVCPILSTIDDKTPTANTDVIQTKIDVKGEGLNNSVLKLDHYAEEKLFSAVSSTYILKIKA